MDSHYVGPEQKRSLPATVFYFRISLFWLVLIDIMHNIVRLE
jgi:hypothetical protein